MFDVADEVVDVVTQEDIVNDKRQQKQKVINMRILILPVLITHNAANHRQQKAERGTSGAFCCPSAFALLAAFMNILKLSKIYSVY